MSNRVRQALSFCSVCAIAVAVLAPSIASAGQSDQKLLDALRAKDRELTAAFTMRLEIGIPAHPFDSDQGTQWQSCILTCGPDRRAIVAHSRFEKAPVFQPMGFREYQSVDYDADGNLILWRELEKYALFAPAINDAYVVKQMLRVNPQGAVVDTVRHVQLQRYLTGSDDNVYELGQVLLSSGRGFSTHIAEILESRALGGGKTELRAQGSYGPALPGTWTLTVDGADQLVRSASFVPDGAGEPAILVESSGRIEADGLVVSKAGVLTFTGCPTPNYRISVSIRDIAKKVDLFLLGEAEDRVEGPLPPGEAEVIDFRTEPVERTFIAEQ